MSSVALKTASNTKTSTKNTETKTKDSLSVKFKKYIMANLPMICGGILAMNGQTNGYYTYKMLLK